MQVSRRRKKHRAMTMSSAGRMAGSLQNTFMRKGRIWKQTRRLKLYFVIGNLGTSISLVKSERKVGDEAQCQGSAMCLPDRRQFESRPLKLGRVTTYLPENYTKDCSCNSLCIYHPHVVGYELSFSLISTEFEHFVQFLYTIWRRRVAMKLIWAKYTRMVLIW